MIKKKIVLIFLPLLLLSTCITSEPEPASPTRQYDKAEVYYLKNPCWHKFGFNVKFGSFFDERHRDLLFSDFIITDKDSLGYISRHIAKGVTSESSPYAYWCPRIIVLLHGPEGVDTLITNTYTNDPVQFNSSIMNDSTLSLYLTECVGKHDDTWAYLSGVYFYSGNMHMLAPDGYAFPPSDSFYYKYRDYDVYNWSKVYPSGAWNRK